MSIHEDSALYLADRLRRLYGVEGQVTRAQLAEIAASRGIRYVVDDTLPRQESCFCLLRDGRAACLISGQATIGDEAHETSHAVTETLLEDGVEFPDLIDQDPEAVAQRMGEALAGPAPPQPPSEALRGFQFPAPQEKPVLRWQPRPRPEPPPPPDRSWEPFRCVLVRRLPNFTPIRPRRVFRGTYRRVR